MSPNVGNFVHDLVEMAKAMETLPQVQAELDRANTSIESYAKQVQDREIAIIAYKQEIDDLHAKVRSLEVERDDASFRVLEAEDTAHSILTLVRTASVDLAIAIQKLDPPKPEPVKEPEPQPITTLASGESATDPTTVAAVPVIENGSVSGTAIQSESASTSTTIPDSDIKPKFISELPADWKQDQAETSLLPSGQSEGSPTVGTSQDEMTSSAPNTVIQEAPASSSMTDGPYFGKRYHDYPVWMPLSEWLDGGGSGTDYYWRPSF